MVKSVHVIKLSFVFSFSLGKHGESSRSSDYVTL